MLQVKTFHKIQNNPSTQRGSERWQILCLSTLELMVIFTVLEFLKICTRCFLGTPCKAVSSKSGLLKFHFQWIWAPMTFMIPKIYVNMLAEFEYYSRCSNVLCFALNFTELLLVFKWVDSDWINISSLKNQTSIWWCF